MSAPTFSVSVTGPEQPAAEEFAHRLAERLGDRHVAVEVLDARTPGIDALAGVGLERRAAFVATLLARHGVVAIVALPMPTRAAREHLRTEVGRMIEVYVRPAREAAGYEAPERPEVEVGLPEPSPGSGVAQVIRTLEVLDFLPRGTHRAYTEEEERQVIRRLKAFGYL